MRLQLLSNNAFLKKSVISASLIIGTIMLAGCADEESAQTIAIEVSKSDFNVRVPAVGELEAAKATTIGMPGGVFEPQVISWLAEENKFVKKGEVVARLDPRKYNDLSKQENFNVDKADITYQSKESSLTNEEKKLKNDSRLTSEELILADKYTVEDLRVFSRNEIIDSMKNKQYLNAKQDYTQWRIESHSGMSQAELELLELQKAQYTAKLDMYRNILNQLEIIAPHDGVFVLDKNWRGEKPRVGQTTWPGRKLGSLPDMSEIRARIYILETEAAGIKVGHKVTFSLDAYPDQEINGELEQIDSIAKPRNNQNPVKYFEAVVKITDEKKPIWKPGSQIKATIHPISKSQVIYIPSQAIFFEDGRYFVYARNSSDWIKKTVKLGARSVAKTEIVDGLLEGDKVALFPPKGVENEVL